MTAGHRSAIVLEARSWLGTPFHHEARVKHAGVDCLQLLVGVYAAVGLLPDLDTPHYSPDWHLHQTEELYLDGIRQYCDLLPASELPQPGDIAMFRYGHQAAHGAIVIEWPTICHAWRDAGRVVLSDATSGPLARRLVGFWRLKTLTAGEGA